VEKKRMDFSNRSVQPQQAAQGTHAAPAGANRRNNRDKSKWARLGVVAAVAAVVILLVAVALTAAGSANNNESKYVDSGKLQAVFLNTGQVYFGNVKDLNNKYLVLTNIYYLQTSSTGTSNTQQNANTSVSLVKLGCELHEPFDKMVINRSQVTFWENLQDGGQVAKAVSTFEKQNPNGQKCADQSASSSNTSNSVQNAGTSSTPSSSTTTNKP
jgi:hypothetical protein